MAARFQSVIRALNSDLIQKPEVCPSVRLKLVEAAPNHRVPLLIWALRNDRDPKVRAEAAWELWKAGDKAACRPLLDALLKDPSIDVREKAARSLGFLGSVEAVATLAGLLKLGKHVRMRIRAAAVASLGFLKCAGTIDTVIAASWDAEPFVRAESIAALSRLFMVADEDAKERVLQRLKKSVSWWHEAHALVRCAAIRALSMVQGEDTEKSLAKALRNDRDADVRVAAADAIGLWTGRHVEAGLIRALSDDSWTVRKVAAGALSRLITRSGAVDSGAVCEALSRMMRMFPRVSPERRLAEEALAAL